MSEIERQDIMAKIPRPTSSGGTARTTTRNPVVLVS